MRYVCQEKYFIHLLQLINKTCQIPPIFICHVSTFVAFNMSIFTTSVLIFPTFLSYPASSLSFHSSDPCTAWDIQHCPIPFSLTSGEMCCHATLIHRKRGVTLNFLILPAGVKALLPSNSHSHSTSNTYSHPPGKTISSVFMELTVAFISGVKYLSS